jgi:hypothetical protein
MKRFSLVALIFCVSCSSSLAQETNACQTRDVTVNVRDSKGELMTGLQPASFRATLGRQPMRVLASNIVVSGSRVVLLLDLSASMNPEWDLVRSAANHFVVNASAPLRIGLVTFSDHIIETLNVGSSSHDIHDIIERITKPPDGKGHTSLYDSMAFAAGLFQKPLPGDAIYVFTDGGDNRSKLNRGDVERLLLSRGIRLFWFDLYDRYFPTEQGQEGHVDVEDLVKKSGGIAVTADDATLTKGQEFNKLVSGIYDSMKNFYVLNVETPAGADDNHAWDLQVLDDQGKKLKGIWVFYPKRLPPCATTSLH